jgi:chromatin segregation and condensation protein Rec8/ScpA/Scc1 (kleisin family)
MGNTAPARTGVRAGSVARRASPALIAALVLGVAACGAQQEQRSAQNLCARYHELVARADAVTALDPRTTKADAIQARADTALVKLDELQAISEGRYDTLISSLRAAVNDVKQSAVTAGESVAAVSQERQDALQSLSESLGPLKQRLDVQCGASG